MQNNQNVYQAVNPFGGHSEPSQISSVAASSRSRISTRSGSQGAYSRMQQIKQEAKQKEMLQKMEENQNRDKIKIKEYKQIQILREKRLAEQRIKEINEQNSRIQNQKNQQREYYLKYLRETAEKNIDKLRQGPAEQYHQSELPKLDVQKNVQQKIQNFRQRWQKPVSRIGGGITNTKGQQPDLDDLNTRFNAIFNKKDDDDDPMLKTSNLDGLDLEFSQTISKGIEKKEEKQAVIQKNELLDSLDLNVGMDALEKLKEVWGKKKKAKDPSQQPKGPEKIKEPEDEDSMQGTQMPKPTVYSQNSQDWLSQSIRQSVADWKNLFKKKEEDNWINKNYEEIVEKQTPEVKEEPKTDPYVEEFSSRKFGQQTLEFLQFEQKVQDIFEDPALVPKNLPKNQGSYGQAFQQKKIEEIQKKVDRTASGNRKPQSLQKLKALQEKTVLSKEEEEQAAKEKKERLDEIKKKYSRKSTSRRRIVSAKQETQSTLTGQVSQLSANPSAAAPSVKQSPLTKEALNMLNGKPPLLKPPSGYQNVRQRSKNLDQVSKCTRDDNLEIDEFMKDDLRLINKEEEKLQRELLKMNQKNLAKHAMVVKQNNINTNLKNTEQLVRKMMNVEQTSKDCKQRTPLHQKLERPDAPASLDEADIQDSIDNLDMLLANKKYALEKLGGKYGIQQYQQPFQVPDQAQLMQKQMEIQQKMMMIQQQIEKAAQQKQMSARGSAMGSARGSSREKQVNVQVNQVNSQANQSNGQVNLANAQVNQAKATTGYSNLQNQQAVGYSNPQNQVSGYSNQQAFPQNQPSSYSNPPNNPFSGYSANKKPEELKYSPIPQAQPKYNYDFEEFISQKDDLNHGMELSLKKKQDEILIDFEGIEANVRQNKQNVDKLMANKKEFANNQYKSELADYSKLNPDLQKLLGEFENDQSCATHTQSESQKSQVTFQLSQDTNEMVSPKIDKSANSKDMNALAELCQIQNEQPKKDRIIISDKQKSLLMDMFSDQTQQIQSHLNK